MQISSRSILLIFVSAILLVFPSLIFGQGGYDLIFHMVWSHNFTEQLWNGDLYPRWMYKMNAGCGGPDFFFYTPFPYYMTSIFYFLDDIAPVGWYSLLATSFLVFFLSGIFFYFWLKNFVDDISATLGAMSYILMPYVWWDLYYRLAFSELFTFLWLPILLYCTHQIANNKKIWIMAFTFCYALQLLSNIPGTVLVSCLITVYFFYEAKREFYIKGSLLMTFGVMGGFCLAAFYIIPIIYNLPYVHIGSNLYMQEKIFNYKNSFLFAPNNENKIGSYFITLFTTMIVIASIILNKAIQKRRNSGKKGIAELSKFWLVVGFLAVFMISSFSQPLWEIFPFLKAVRHPTRFLLIQSVSLSMLIAFLMSLQKTDEEREKSYWIFATGIICLIIPMSVMFIDFSRRAMDGPALSSNHKNMQKYYTLNTVILHEYIPTTTDIEWIIPSGIDALTEECKKGVSVLKGSAEFEVKQWKPREIIIDVKALSRTTLQISQFAFPGWVAKNMINEKEIKLGITNGMGLIKLDLPAGESKILLHMPTKEEEKIGFLISLLTLAGLGLASVLCWIRKHKVLS